MWSMVSERCRRCRRKERRRRWRQRGARGGAGTGRRVDDGGRAMLRRRCWVAGKVSAQQSERRSFDVAANVVQRRRGISGSGTMRRYHRVGAIRPVKVAPPVSGTAHSRHEVQYHSHPKPRQSVVDETSLVAYTCSCLQHTFSTHRPPRAEDSSRGTACRVGDDPTSRISIHITHRHMGG